MKRSHVFLTFSVLCLFLSLGKGQTSTTKSALAISGRATLVEVGEGECGCKKYRAAVGKRCRGSYRWQIQRRFGFWNWRNVSSRNITPGGGSADWEFTLCPEDYPPGEYRVKITCSKGFLWGGLRTNKVQFSPPPYQIRLQTQLNGSSEYRQSFCCGARITLTVPEQSCVKKWRIFVRKWDDVTGSHHPVQYFGPWQSGPVPFTHNINDFFRQQNLDFVPGACYKVDIEVQGLVNGTQWASVGKMFCIKCKCE